MIAPIRKSITHSLHKAEEWIFANPEQAEVMGRRGREAVLTRYNWRCEEAKLLAFYERMDGAE
mgnify:CR=1 FL=1